jgi:hypothetical protein
MQKNEFGAQQRENPDPTEKDRPIPRYVLLGVGIALAWAISYILTVRDDDPALGDRRTISTLQALAAPLTGRRCMRRSAWLATRRPVPACRAYFRRWQDQNG